MNLTKYKNIFILDDDADDIWCKHDMIELKMNRKVNILLFEVPKLDIWQNIYRHYSALSGVREHKCNLTLLYNLVSDYQQRDKVFVHFHNFLELLHSGATQKVLRQFAVLMPDETGLNRQTRIVWRWVD